MKSYGLIVTKFLNFKDSKFQDTIKKGKEGKTDETISINNIPDGQKKSISAELAKIGISGDILDAKTDTSNGVGSFGVEKITIAIKSGNDVKIYELKEQDSKHTADNISGTHKGEERSQVAEKLGDDTKSITLNGKNYTVGEIVPNYSKFDVKGKGADGNDNTSVRIDYASTFMAGELARLHTGQATAIIGELDKPKTIDRLVQGGTNFGKAVLEVQKSYSSDKK